MITPNRYKNNTNKDLSISPQSSGAAKLLSSTLQPISYAPPVEKPYEWRTQPYPQRPTAGISCATVLAGRKKERKKELSSPLPEIIQPAKDISVINGTNHCHTAKVQVFQIWDFIKCNPAKGNYFFINYSFI